MADNKIKEHAADAPANPPEAGEPGGQTKNTTTRGIRIEVQSKYLAERSSPRDDQYLFAYQVRISNVGTETAQLMSREWVITSAEGDVEHVKGPGVVGEQPVLAPGGSFEYTSYCPLKTAVGSMHGTYQMVTGDGETFDARIAPFTLAIPNALH
ncbi:MAG: Co2+/Mg2+ efflux protein ApaG [Acidobacteria bacterium]|nr:Co2+/Mg2+ efflux protein ApaG [Acidobacteriota bacterium]